MRSPAFALPRLSSASGSGQRERYPRWRSRSQTVRVQERHRAAALARHYRDQEGLTIAEIAQRLGRAPATVKRTCMTRLARRHARSRRTTGECVAAAGRPPRHGTARATPTRIANAAIPARLRRNGPENGFAKRCADGERATALRRPRTTGRARTHARGAAAKRSNDYRPSVRGRTCEDALAMRKPSGWIEVQTIRVSGRMATWNASLESAGTSCEPAIRWP